MPERQRETIQRRLGVRRSRVGRVEYFDQCRSVGGADRALAVLVAAAHHQRCRRPNPTATAVAPRHSSLLLAPGFGARPLGPPVTPLTASLNFLTDVVIRWLTGLGAGPPEEAAFGVLGLLGTAFAMGTVLRRPLIAAAPPKGLLLIAMPGVVLVTVRPFLKTEPASASGPGPAATV